MSAQLSSTTLLVIALAPLVGSIVAGVGGRRIGRAGAHSVTILGVLISFVLSVFVLKDVIDGARFHRRWNLQARKPWRSMRGCSPARVSGAGCASGGRLSASAMARPTASPDR